MKIEGMIQNDGHAYISAFISRPDTERVYPIIFLADLGATVTTILEGDCIRLGIDCNQLEKTPTQTITPGGKTDTYSLRDVVLIFKTRKGILDFERLERIDVIRPRPDSVLLPFSLLGIDVIGRFKATYEKTHGLTLEK